MKELDANRGDYIVTTKLFMITPTVNRTGNSRKHLIEGLNESLKRL